MNLCVLWVCLCWSHTLCSVYERDDFAWRISFAICAVQVLWKNYVLESNLEWRLEISFNFLTFILNNGVWMMKTLFDFPECKQSTQTAHISTTLLSLQLKTLRFIFSAPGSTSNILNTYSEWWGPPWTQYLLPKLEQFRSFHMTDFCICVFFCALK